jgi:Protein of unknown function DUF262/Protein of unknown function (DUF1524)
VTAKITGAEYPLAKIFSSDFDYEIPPYQRPYAWTKEEAGELFDDLLTFYQAEQDDSYFLGSIVLIKQEGKPRAEVIDGQQRLTSLTILFSAITSSLTGEERADFRSYVLEPGSASQNLKPKPRLALRERDKAFFAKYVQGLQLDKLHALDPEQLENESQKNIYFNAKLFVDRLLESFGDDQVALIAFGSFLVLRCFLVSVSTPSQHSAFRVFSVMNSRGLDLLPTDIIKADLIGRIPSSAQHKYTEKWEELEVHVGRKDFAELFGHIRMIYAKTKARRNLLEDFPEHVQSREKSPQDLISNVIEPYADAYLVARNQSYLSTTNAAEVNQLLWWLNRIDNSDWVPATIVYLAKKLNNQQDVLSFFEGLERLAAFMHVCGKNVNFRIERYAQVLTALEKRTHAAYMRALDLTKEEKKEFLNVLDGEVYWLAPRRRNYLLQRVDSFYSDGAATYQTGVMTVEHVLPQTVSSGSEWETWWPDGEVRDKWVHRLANLVPLTQKRNSAAQNFSFSKKKTAYFGGKQGVSSYVLTTQVLNSPTWTPKVVRQRQTHILSVLEESWILAT